MNSHFAPRKLVPGVIAAPSLCMQSFVEELLTTNFEKSKILLYLVSANLTSAPHQRRCTIIVSEQFTDFIVIFNQISTRNFKFNGFFLIVLIAGEYREIENIFALMWKLNIYNVNVVFEDEMQNVSVMTFKPFSSDSCNDTSPVLIDEFRNGKFMNGVENFYPNKFKSLHNCLVNVAIANNAAPYIIADRFENGSMKLGGRDIELVTTLAETLSFRINYSYIGTEGYFFENGSSEGPLREIKEGRADLAVADFWLKANRLKHFEASSSYVSEHIVFIISQGVEYNSLEKLIFPFTFATWLLVLSAVCGGFVVIFFVRKQPKMVQTFVLGASNRNPFLNLFIALIGGSQKKLPGNNFARFLLMMFLIFTLVTRTLYQGSFYQLIRSNG